MNNNIGLEDELVVKYVFEGEELTSEVINYNELASDMALPDIEGYRFGYWAGEDGEPFDFTKPITSDITLTAIYEADEYAIRYDLDGGSVASGNPTTYTVESDEITLRNPTKTGYTFIGWSGTDLEGNNNKAVIIAKGSTGERFYEAHFVPNNYTIKYNANNGTGTMPEQAMTYDVASNLARNAFERDDFEFAGWNTAANGSGTSFVGEASVNNLTAENGATINLYAQWAEMFPVVFSHVGACTFNGNDGLVTGDDCNDYHGTNLINTGIELFNAENYEKDFEISFNIDHFVPSEQSEAQASLMNTKLENIDAKYPGYVIRDIVSDNSKLEYTGVSPKTFSKSTVTFAVSAITKFSFKRLNGKLYYRVNDGPYIYMNQDVTGGTLRFDTPVTFGGSLDAILNSEGGYDYVPFRVIRGTLSNMEIRLGKMNTNNIRTVALNGNGGSSKTLQYIAGSSFGAEFESKREGYIFNGWYTARDGGEKVTSDTIITNNVTYYAHWLKSAQSLAFEQESLTLRVGDTAQLVPLNADEIAEEWTYSSGRSTTAIVDNDGLVTAVGVGETYIRVGGKTSGQYKDISIIVSGSVYDMVFAESPISISVNDTFDAKANIINLSDIQEEYTFDSSDKGVFTVDAKTGMIVAKQKGVNKKLRIKGKTSGITVEIVVDVTD